MLYASPPVFNTATYILVVCVEKVNVEVTPAGVLTWWMASEESGGGGGGDGGGGGVWHSTLAIQLKLTRMTSQTLQGAPPGCPRILTKAPGRGTWHLRIPLLCLVNLNRRDAA